MPTLVVASVTVPVTLWLPAATYGPTNGPPPPTGGAPAGWTKAVPLSASARAMLMRPVPVWIWVPAGLALPAQPPTEAPLLRGGAPPLIDPAGPRARASRPRGALMTVLARP